jgi:hypothetical protein
MIEVVAHEKFYKGVAHEPFTPQCPRIPGLIVLAHLL